MRCGCVHSDSAIGTIAGVSPQCHRAAQRVAISAIRSAAQAWFDENTGMQRLQRALARRMYMITQFDFTARCQPVASLNVALEQKVVSIAWAWLLVIVHLDTDARTVKPCSASKAADSTMVVCRGFFCRPATDLSPSLPRTLCARHLPSIARPHQIGSLVIVKTTPCARKTFSVHIGQPDIFDGSVRPSKLRRIHCRTGFGDAGLAYSCRGEIWFYLSLKP
jgi:hypothetical protein